jgi:hypothetical protein
MWESSLKNFWEKNFLKSNRIDIANTLSDNVIVTTYPT